jgi:hypothetical protein
MRRRPGRSAPFVLIGLLGVTYVLREHLFFAVVLAPLLATWLAAELDRESLRVAAAIVKLAAKLMPPDVRAAEHEEWDAHVNDAGQYGLRPVIAALSIAAVAPALSWYYRNVRARSVASPPRRDERLR